MHLFFSGFEVNCIIIIYEFEIKRFSSNQYQNCVKINNNYYLLLYLLKDEEEKTCKGASD